MQRERGVKLTVCSVPHINVYKSGKDFRLNARMMNEAIHEALVEKEEFLFLIYIQDEEDCMAIDGVHYSFKGAFNAARPIVRRVANFLKKPPVWIQRPPEVLEATKAGDESGAQRKEWTNI